MLLAADVVVCFYSNLLLIKSCAVAINFSYFKKCLQSKLDAMQPPSRGLRHRVIVTFRDQIKEV